LEEEIKTMKKITLLYDFLKELGGLERVMFFHANKLKKDNKVNILFSYISDKDKEKVLKELELDEGVKVSQIGRIKNEIIALAASFLFPSRIKKIKADLIFSHSFMCTRMAYKKKKIDGTKYIVIMHHPPNFLYSPPKGWANNLARGFALLLGMSLRPIIKKMDIVAVKNADLVIVSSHNAAKRIQNIYDINPKIVYPNISNYFKPLIEFRKKDFLKNKNIVRPFLLAHGRIIPDKNYKAVISMLKPFNEYDLIISGSISNSYRKEIEEEIMNQGLQNRVKILGRIPKEDLLGYYNTASLFLMPAFKEDFGLTIVEAIACGCPVIAWDDKAGPSEIISEDNGVLALPYGDKDFVRKMKLALNKKWDKERLVNSVKRFSETEIEKEFISTVQKFV
jgi:glycosyltransferase involved in cell wall biosynthesis